MILTSSVASICYFRVRQIYTELRFKLSWSHQRNGMMTKHFEIPILIRSEKMMLINILKNWKSINKMSIWQNEWKAMFYLYGEKISKKYCKTKIKKKIHVLKSKWYIGEIKFTVLIFFPEELVIILLIGL